MHFLGAVITERKEDLEDVLAPWSEYNDVPEHVSKTRGEFLAECRSLDRAEVRLGGGLDSPEGRSLVRQARERLALGDKDALKAYAEYNGVTLNAYGDVLSTFNEDSFYDYWEPADEWETLDGQTLKEHHGKTCGEILATHGDLLKEVCVTVADGTCEGGLFEDLSEEAVKATFESHPHGKVWWVNFHD